MSVSPQLFGGNCCCIGSQHGAVAVAPRYGWSRCDWASLGSPASAADVKSFSVRYKTQTFALESGTPPACISAILPAALDVDTRTGQCSGTDWTDYIYCDGNPTREVTNVSIESATERLHTVGSEFVLRETLSEAWTDEEMEEILDEILAAVDWEDLLLYDDAHCCHHVFRYDDGGVLESFQLYDPSEFTPCSDAGAQALKLVCGGFAFYATSDLYWSGSNLSMSVFTLNAAYADPRLDAVSAFPTYGAKWAIHSRSMREKRSTRSLEYATQVIPAWFYSASVLTYGFGSATWGVATDTSPTSCATSNWDIDAPDGGTLGYPLSAFTVVARGTLAADLGY